MREVQPLARSSGRCHRQMDQEGGDRFRRIRHGLPHRAEHRGGPFGGMQHRQSQEEGRKLAQDPRRHNSLPGIRQIGAHPLQGRKAQSGHVGRRRHMLPQGLQLQDRREGHQVRKTQSRSPRRSVGAAGRNLSQLRKWQPCNPGSRPSSSSGRRTANKGSTP